jgi:hypothetical protein
MNRRWFLKVALSIPFFAELVRQAKGFAPPVRTIVEDPCPALRQSYDASIATREVSHALPLESPQAAGGINTVIVEWGYPIGPASGKLLVYDSNGNRYAQHGRNEHSITGDKVQVIDVWTAENIREGTNTIFINFDPPAEHGQICIMEFSGVTVLGHKRQNLPSAHFVH